ncbi:hypothetical protein E4P39_01405 [Blastococcus sp. CT_GayMR19]|uniref:hypothetical protein n=1 Tax=Blastococcus sp. CT_GayMR19 TaxID=2559608 RepID=UPI0010742013|nr:hypothetical protein [Blastococcus sp. CT_GayMR19]TFV79331.1 hypothetical protein E4P39_01405 [Blastococcus sp. CT_GayMR19]
MRLQRSRRGAGLVLAAALALTGAGLSGCADGTDDSAMAPDLEPEVPDIRGEDELDDPYRGLLDAAFVEDLPAYDTQEVTVLAAVDEVLSPRSFTVTSPSDSEVGPVLVVTAEKAAEFEPGAGDELILAATAANEFDADAVAEDYGLTLDSEQYEEWNGEMFLVATIIQPAP